MDTLEHWRQLIGRLVPSELSSDNLYAGFGRHRQRGAVASPTRGAPSPDVPSFGQPAPQAYRAPLPESLGIDDGGYGRAQRPARLPEFRTSVHREPPAPRLAKLLQEGGFNPWNSNVVN